MKSIKPKSDLLIPIQFVHFQRCFTIWPVYVCVWIFDRKIAISSFGEIVPLQRTNGWSMENSSGWSMCRHVILDARRAFWRDQNKNDDCHRSQPIQKCMALLQTNYQSENFYYGFGQHFNINSFDYLLNFRNMDTDICFEVVQFWCCVRLQ